MCVGGSAGAVGMMSHVDFLSAYLPEDATIRAYMDSPYVMDVDLWSGNSNSGATPFSEQYQGMYNNFNVSAVISSQCAEAYEGEEWKCLMGQYRMPYVWVRYAMVASSFDSYQLATNIGYGPTDWTYANESAYQYALDLANATRASLWELSNGAGGITPYIFSWACYSHDVSMTKNFWLASSDGVAENDVVESLTTTYTAVTLIDDCDGLFCGTECGDGAPTYSPTMAPVDYTRVPSPVPSAIFTKAPTPLPSYPSPKESTPAPSAAFTKVPTLSSPTEWTRVPSASLTTEPTPFLAVGIPTFLPTAREYFSVSSTSSTTTVASLFPYDAYHRAILFFVFICVCFSWVIFGVYMIIAGRFDYSTSKGYQHSDIRKASYGLHSDSSSSLITSSASSGVRGCVVEDTNLRSDLVDEGTPLLRA